MELITRRDDPYIQPEDDSDEDEEDRLPEVETRVRACPKCWAEEYGPEADKIADEINGEQEQGDGQPPDDKS